MKRGYAGEHVPLLPAMLAGTAEDQGEGLAIPAYPHHTPIDLVSSTSKLPNPSTNEPSHSSPPRQIDRQDTEIPQSQGPTITPVADEATITGVGVETEGAATINSSLDAGLDSGNIHESPLRSHDAPLPEDNISRSAEDSLKLKELMEIVPKLESKVDSLEKELKETKHTLGNVVLTLVKKVKSLEVALKRKTKKMVLSDLEDEETENQGRNVQDIDDDPLVSLVRDYMEEKEADFVTPTKVSASGEAQEEDISTTALEAAKTLSQKVNVIVPSPVKVQREGKAPMPTEDVQTTKRTKAQIQQERAGLVEAIRLQALQDEEAARQVHLDALLAKRIQEEQELSEQQLKRKDQVQEAAQYYTEEDWDTIRAKLEANAELTKSLQGKNVSSDDFAKKMVDMIN
ncbi:hypothetical protein Tco_1494532 [Tanacetum coccineum]